MLDGPGVGVGRGVGVGVGVAPGTGVGVASGIGVAPGTRGSVIIESEGEGVIGPRALTPPHPVTKAMLPNRTSDVCIVDVIFILIRFLTVLYDRELAEFPIN